MKNFISCVTNFIDRKVLKNLKFFCFNETFFEKLIRYIRRPILCESIVFHEEFITEEKIDLIIITRHKPML